MARRSQKKQAGLVRGFKIFFIGTCFVFLIVFLCNQAVSFVRTSDLFRIKEVVKSPSIAFLQSSALEQLKGKSIFSVDLPRLEKFIRAQYPQMDDLRVSRRLPDKIYITATKRDPFVFVKTSRKYILLDQEGVVLAQNLDADDRFPKIEGVPVSQNIPVGKPWRDRNLQMALTILRYFHGQNVLKSYSISSVDVHNLSKIRLNIGDSLEIFIDQEHLADKLRKLTILLSQGSGSIDFENVTYIDLRFREPILGKKAL
ncbi:MAG: cell division protein FtsQ/DivIB [Candidatus Omnitrophica bacterium]|nr:cell division protein FtsQ/DivIB [Candidatus Omnitrophota bacterium]